MADEDALQMLLRAGSRAGPGYEIQCSSSLQVLCYTVNTNEKLPLSPANCNSIVKNLLQVAIWHLLSFHPCTEGLQATLTSG